MPVCEKTKTSKYANLQFHVIDKAIISKKIKKYTLV